MTTSEVLARTSQQLLAEGHLAAAALVLDVALAEHRAGR